MTDVVKLVLNRWSDTCEDCGWFEGYEFYVNDQEVCSYEGHFGKGKGPWTDEPDVAVAFVQRTLDSLGIKWEYELDEG